MTSAELAALGLAIWGHEWKSPMARALSVNYKTVLRWSQDGPVPDWVELEIRKVMGLGDAKSGEIWPRDEWIVQREEGSRMYVVHTLAPRFIARGVEVDDDGAPVDFEKPADVLTGVTYASGNLVLCEIVWIDPPPGAQELSRLMDQAADALEGAAVG